MTSRRTHLALFVAAALAGTAVAVPAIAQNGSAKIIIKGGAKMKPGKSITDTQRFTPLSATVKAGGTLTIVNKAKSKDPHTVSIVKRSELPRTAAGMNKCYEGGPCAALEQAHTGGEEGEGPPKNPVVNVGEDGFDQPGDSVVLMAKTTRVKVSAAKGRNLSYLCAIHPWMQGTIKSR